MLNDTFFLVCVGLLHCLDTLSRLRAYVPCIQFSMKTIIVSSCAYLELKHLNENAE